MATQFDEYTDALDIEIGSRLRALREARGFRVNGLALAMGISHVTIQRLEAGTYAMKPKRILDAARILAVDPGWFFIGLMPDTFKPRETNAFQLLTRESALVLQKILHLSDKQKNTLMAVANDQLIANEAGEMDPDKRQKMREARHLKVGRGG